MSVSRNRPRQQLDSVPQAKPSHGTGDNLQPAAPGMTPSPGGTIGHSSPVPWTLSVVLTDVDSRDLDALLGDTLPARPPGTSPLPPPQTCPTCGRAYDLFDPDISRLLDLVLVSREALSTATTALSSLTHALEEELP